MAKNIPFVNSKPFSYLLDLINIAGDFPDGSIVQLGLRWGLRKIRSELVVIVNGNACRGEIFFEYFKIFMTLGGPSMKKQNIYFSVADLSGPYPESIVNQDPFNSCFLLFPEVCAVFVLAIGNGGEDDNG